MATATGRGVLQKPPIEQKSAAVASGVTSAVSPSIATPQSPVNLLKDWEKNSTLTDIHNEAIVSLQKFCLERPIPQKFSEDNSQSTNSINGSEKLLDEEIENMQQFYSWYNSLDEESVEEEKFSSRIEALKTYRDYCDGILGEISEALRFLQDLEDKYNLVAKKTGELHSACEALVREQAQLASFADNLEKKLAFFNELPKITQKFSSNTLSIYDGNFKSLIAKLDECIDFVSKNKDFKDSENFLLKYRQLQNRGMIMLKNEIVQTLRTSTAQITTQYKTSSGDLNASLSSSNVTTSYETQISVKFRTIAPKIKPLIEEIEKRSNIKEYNVLLDDCQRCYFQQRRILLNSLITTTVSNFAKDYSDLCGMTRNGCMYLINLCQNEFQLHQHFFNYTPNNSGLLGLLEGFSTILYTTFRPVYIRNYSIELLCQLIYMLKNEMLGEQMDRGESVASVRSIAKRMVQDIQERLIYLSQTYIRDEISGYVPTPEDLNYPDKLIALSNAESLPCTTQSPAIQSSVASLLATLASGPDKSNPTDKLGASNKVIKNALGTNAWFPTLERTLVCLSKLYLTLDTRIFEGIATEAVNICTNTLLDASKQISQKSGIDGQLFLIKHFFILKEQLTPFDISFSITEQILDFSQTTETLKRLMSGGLLSVPSTLLSAMNIIRNYQQLINAVQPRVEIHQLDSKKDLETGLKACIEMFVSTATKSAIDLLVSFITKANAFVRVEKKSNMNDTSTLRNQSFATTDKVIGLLDETSKNISQKLHAIIQKMKLYIANFFTQQLLINPIRERIIDSLDQLKQLVLTHYSPEDLEKIRIQDGVQSLIQLMDSSLSDSLQDKDQHPKATPVNSVTLVHEELHSNNNTNNEVKEAIPNGKLEMTEDLVANCVLSPVDLHSQTSVSVVARDNHGM